jgi:hypothetical protein
LVDKDYGAEESAVGENCVDIDAEDALAEKGETGVAEEGNGHSRGAIAGCGIEIPVFPSCLIDGRYFGGVEGR